MGATLRVTKGPPDDVVLAWQDAPADASHDEALTYETWAADVACGPFTWLAATVRVPGVNRSADPVLRAPPPLRHYLILSLNDGGSSLPLPPDGGACP